MKIIKFLAWEGGAIKILYVDIKKKLGDFQLDLQFEVNNQTLALLGSSGCGKSLTLKCIAGIETPDQGEIVLNGRTLFNHKKKINIPSQKRKVGILFQNYALFPNMTLRDNILIGIKKGRINKEKIIKKMINDFSLVGLENNYPHQLSGGQQQRVALARMIVNEPEILMLDEPFSALDVHLKWQMEGELIHILKSYRGEVLYVSHNKDEVFRVSDLIATMNQGRIEEFATKLDLFTRPKSVHSAILTGCKNISKAEKIDDSKVLAKDWNLVLQCNNIDDEINYLGINDYDLKIVNSMDNENTYEFHIVDIINNPDTNIGVLLSPDNPQHPIYIKISQKDYDDFKAMKNVYIQFNIDKISLFR